MGMLPHDDFILLSYLNTKLRDEYDSLDELCDEMEIDRVEVEKRLQAAGYVYSAAQNKFV